MSVRAPAPSPTEASTRRAADGDAGAARAAVGRAAVRGPQGLAPVSGTFARCLARGGAAPAQTPTATASDPPCANLQGDGGATASATRDAARQVDPRADGASEGLAAATTGRSAGAAAAGATEGRASVGRAESGSGVVGAPPPGVGIAAIRGIEGMVRAVAVSELRGMSTVRLQLDGGRFGPIAVALQMRGGRLCTRFAIDQTGEYAALRAALPQLEAALRERGLSIAPVELQLGALPGASLAAGAAGERKGEGRGAALDASLGAGAAPVERGGRVPAAPARPSSPIDYVA